MSDVVTTEDLRRAESLERAHGRPKSNIDRRHIDNNGRFFFRQTKIMFKQNQLIMAARARDRQILGEFS